MATVSDAVNEEVVKALEGYNTNPGDIPSILEEYLLQIAKTGATLMQWSKLKPLLSHKLDVTTREFQDKFPIEDQNVRPNVERATFEELHSRIMVMLKQFNGAPFTIQRICELLTNPHKHYTNTEKYMRGLEKTLSVVTTVDSHGNRVVCESKPIINGLESGESTPTSHHTKRLEISGYSPGLSPLGQRNTPNTSEEGSSTGHTNSPAEDQSPNESTFSTLTTTVRIRNGCVESSDVASDLLSDVGGDNMDCLIGSPRVINGPASPKVSRKLDEDLDDTPPSKLPRLQDLGDEEADKPADKQPDNDSSSTPLLGQLLNNEHSSSSSVDPPAADKSAQDQLAAAENQLAAANTNTETAESCDNSRVQEGDSMTDRNNDKAESSVDTPEVDNMSTDSHGDAPPAVRGEAVRGEVEVGEDENTSQSYSSSNSEGSSDRDNNNEELSNDDNSNNSTDVINSASGAEPSDSMSSESLSNSNSNDMDTD